MWLSYSNFKGHHEPPFYVVGRCFPRRFATLYSLHALKEFFRLKRPDRELQFASRTALVLFAKRFATFSVLGYDGE
jgi:hypothetical protein